MDEQKLNNYVNCGIIRSVSNSYLCMFQHYRRVLICIHSLQRWLQYILSFRWLLLWLQSVIGRGLRMILQPFHTAISICMTWKIHSDIILSISSSSRQFSSSRLGSSSARRLTACFDEAEWPLSVKREWPLLRAWESLIEFCWKRCNCYV